jgi:hypothetical protein
MNAEHEICGEMEIEHDLAMRECAVEGRLRLRKKLVRHISCLRSSAGIGAAAAHPRAVQSWLCSLPRHSAAGRTSARKTEHKNRKGFPIHSRRWPPAAGTKDKGNYASAARTLVRAEAEEATLSRTNANVYTPAKENIVTETF